MFAKPCSKSLLPHVQGLNSNVRVLTVLSNQKACNICGELNENTAHACCHQLPVSTPASDVNRYTKWQPDISGISRASSDISNALNVRKSDFVDAPTPDFDRYLFACSPLNGNYEHLSAPVHLATTSHLSTFAEPMTSGASLASCPSLDIAQETDYLQPERSRMNSLGSYNSGSSIGSSGQSSNSGTTFCSEFDDVSVAECSMASEQLIQRDLSVRTILNAEQDYINDMKNGIQAFSRPLRICISSQQKEVLFQNVEKVCHNPKHLYETGTKYWQV